MYNLYDFDKTIYSGDSSIDFYRFLLKKKPSIIKYLPVQMLAILKYKLKIISKKEMKEKYFIFLKGVNDINNQVNNFWDKNYKKIKKWYINKEHSKDIIISASPEFLLMPLKEQLTVKDIIATKVNKKTGKFETENCYGKEKVRRLYEKYPKIKISQAYSDSMSDIDMLKLAQESFIVKNKKINKIDKEIL